MFDLLRNWKSFGKVLLGMYALTAGGLCLLADAVQQLGWEVRGITIGISLIYGFSGAVGGFLIGKVQKNRKFLWGIIMGLFYVLVLLVITLLVKGGTEGTLRTVIWNLLLCMFSGMLGGMVS